MAIRIPGWARGEVVPSDLYYFADNLTNDPVTLKVNGEPVAIKLSHGYAILERTWKSGDVVDLDLPMPARRVMANSKVKADIGRVALERGPIVFCAEWPDNPSGKVRNLNLPNGQALTADFEPALLNGVEILKGKAVSISRASDGSSVKTQQDFEAIPYFAWANRGKGEMTVWLADSEAGAPAP